MDDGGVEYKKGITFDEIVDLFLPALARAVGGKVDREKRVLVCLVKLEDGELYRLELSRASLSE